MRPAALIGFSSVTARKALEGAFEDAGFRTVTCASGRQAQQALADDPGLRVAVLDPELPEGGLQAAAQRTEGEADPPDPRRLQRKLEVIERQVHRLNALVLELLDIARITGRRLELRLEELDLVGLASEVAASFGNEICGGGCEIRLHAEQRPVPGTWDRGRLEQVLNNLLSNAVKYGPGKPVDVVVRQAGSDAEIEIRDQGIGIPKEAQARIFDRFERAVSVRQYGGLGLGLWITRQIIEAHGGTITVESQPGQGSSFRVRLPTGPPAAAARPRAPA